MDDGVVAKMIKIAVINVSTVVPLTVTRSQDVQDVVNLAQVVDVLIQKPTVTSVFAATFASFAAKLKTEF